MRGYTQETTSRPYAWLPSNKTWNFSVKTSLKFISKLCNEAGWYLANVWWSRVISCKRVLKQGDILQTCDEAGCYLADVLWSRVISCKHVKELGDILQNLIQLTRVHIPWRQPKFQANPQRSAIVAWHLLAGLFREAMLVWGTDSMDGGTVTSEYGTWFVCYGSFTTQMTKFTVEQLSSLKKENFWPPQLYHRVLFLSKMSKEMVWKWTKPCLGKFWTIFQIKNLLWVICNNFV